MADFAFWNQSTIDWALEGDLSDTMGPIDESTGTNGVKPIAQLNQSNGTEKTISTQQNNIYIYIYQKKKKKEEKNVSGEQTDRMGQDEKPFSYVTELNGRLPSSFSQSLDQSVHQ